MSKRPHSEPQPAPSRATAVAQRASLGRSVRAACSAAALALLVGGACGDDPAPPPAASADAGLQCEIGARNCACIGGIRCGGGLVCIAGRCSLSSDERPEDTPRPRPRPRPPNPDLLDAGSAAPPETSAPDASSPAGDAAAGAPGAESEDAGAG